jgi:hypothetical protein
MKTLDTVRSFLSWGPSAVTKLERLAAIEVRLPEITRELQAAQDEPVTRAEHAERVITWLRQSRARFASRPPAGQIWPEVGDVIAPLASWRSPSDPVVDGRNVWSVVSWLLGAQLEAAVPKAFALLTEPDHGQPAAGREEKIATLSRERAELVAEHERLVDEVSDASGGRLVHAHLPEVVARHAQEEAQRSRTAAIDAERKEREALVNDRHQRRERVAPSPYLASLRRHE